MGMGLGEWSLFPNGNITRGTIVKLDTTTEGYCLQAGSGDTPFGIAGMETHTMSITIQGNNLDDGLAGVAGGPAIKIYGDGATKVPLYVSAATTIGNFLKPDTNGLGTPITSNNDKYIARARQTVPANTVCEVDVIFGQSSNGSI